MVAQIIFGDVSIPIPSQSSVKKLIFGTEATIDLSYIVLKVMRVSPKITVLLSGTLSQTLDLDLRQLILSTAYPLETN